MNLGVLELRRGDYDSAHGAFHEALRLYTTLRNNTSRVGALYNLAMLETERGDLEAAGALYRETASVAEQLGADELAIGAHAGAGLTALRQQDVAAARTALAVAQRIFGTRDDWWFQGRERLEALVDPARDARRSERRSRIARFRARAREARADDVYASGVAARRLRRRARDGGPGHLGDGGSLRRARDGAAVRPARRQVHRAPRLREPAGDAPAAPERSRADERSGRRLITAAARWCDALPNRSAARRGMRRLHRVGDVAPELRVSRRDRRAGSRGS